MTILALVLLAAACLVNPSSSLAAQGADDATMRRMVQYIVTVGQQFYDRGSYSEAEKTFQKAQDYAQHLDPVEQRRLESLRVKAGKAVTERQRIEEARQAAERLNRAGDVPGARARLESIKDSEFLTDQERQEVAGMLRGVSPSPVPAVASVAAPASGDPASPASEVAGTTSVDSLKEVQLVAGDPLGQSKSSIAETYYRSMLAYQSGDLKTAREGFTRVLQSGQMPTAMADSIRGYLARIEVSEAGKEVGRPVPLADVSTQAMPGIGGIEPVNTPSNFRAQNTSAGQGESERIQELYNRSRGLYIQGELVAAREGFAEVARSGMISAPPGLRPEDYIAQIDQQMASQAVPSLSNQTTSVPMMTPVTEQGVTALSSQPSPGDGGFVEEINRRRNTIRAYAENIVNDSIAQAQKFMAQGDFASARDRVDNAVRVVNDYKLYLEGELYKQHMKRLSETSDRIGEAEAQKDKQLAEQKRQDAVEEQRQYRDQAEEDRQKRISELMERAQAYWKQQQYEAAQGQLEALLIIDPLNDEALTMKDMVEDMIYLRKQLQQGKLDRRQTADIKLSTDEATIPYADEITYPKDWREIIQRPTRKPDAPFQLDEANSQIYDQLDQTVDLSAITTTTPASEAFDILRNSVTPPLNLVVLWRDLYENANVEPTTGVDFDGPASARLGTALESMVAALSDPLYPENPVDYVVNRGVVTVATRDGLPRKKLETRVYDVSDLVSPPSTGQNMMGGGMMGGMGGGMMGG
ncbi:MAG: hypothetical protein ABFD90_14960, partial [Phycisphaerales bacterium]